MSAQNLAGDYKHLCISLSEWMRDLLLAIQKNQYQNSHKPSIRRSDFGLWIGHKAHLFLDDAELDGLLDLLDVMDDELRILQTELNDPEQACNSLDRLNNTVSQTIALLSNIAKNTTQVDNAKDTLTQLFNERYLNNILRHEMAYSLRHDILFGITHIDIDSFKQINEQYGHDNGDKILLQLANVLSKQVRAGDFVFRLKGGEFLIILVDINAIMLSKVAEKIREAVEGVVFELDKAATLFITVSIGAALHNRHPDFERTIKLASNALYEAKNTGKNKVVSVS
jgi:diguanylate cyclase